VIDVSGRPLPNSSVSIIYQSYVCGRHDLLTLTTNETGMAHANLVNNVLEAGVYPPCVESQYTIRASYMSAINETLGIVGMYPTYAVVLPVAEYRMNVRMPNGKYLYPVSVTVGTQVVASSTGIVSVELPTGKAFSINVSYGEMSTQLSRSLTGYLIENISLPVYDLHIKLYNDSGERIKGQIKVGTFSQWALLTEDAVFEKFPYKAANFTVIMDNKERHIEKIIDSENISMYADLTIPAIRDVSHAAVTGGILRVSASVSDESNYASGLAFNPVLRYILNDSTEWTVIKMYPKSAKVYEVDVPANGINVVYQVIAEDKQGNMDIYDGRFDFKGSKPLKPPDKPINIIELLSQISLPHIIGIIIFLFIIYLVYRRLREIV
jgi:hypothetical protein